MTAADAAAIMNVRIMDFLPVSTCRRGKAVRDKEYRCLQSNAD